MILDVDDIGRSGRAGELLILGKISADEIEAVKIKNTDEESELLYQDETGFTWLARLYHDFEGRDDLAVSNPSNWSPDGK